MVLAPLESSVKPLIKLANSVLRLVLLVRVLLLHVLLVMVPRFWMDHLVWSIVPQGYGDAQLIAHASLALLLVKLVLPARPPVYHVMERLYLMEPLALLLVPLENGVKLVIELVKLALHLVLRV